jgi:predicted N-acetyltransferase YhbS
LRIRALRRTEIEKVRNIDRREIVEEIYYLEDEQLTLKNEFHNIKGWNPSELEKCIEHLYDVYDRNGTLLGAFDGNKLIAVSALESKFIGKKRDQLQLYFLHVDTHYRRMGIGEKLLGKAMVKAKKLGAKKLYISATPSKNTIDFYIHMGCKLASEVNPKLYKLEPRDIHLQLTFCF